MPHSNKIVDCVSRKFLKILQTCCDGVQNCMLPCGCLVSGCQAVWQIGCVCIGYIIAIFGGADKGCGRCLANRSDWLCLWCAFCLACVLFGLCVCAVLGVVLGGNTLSTKMVFILGAWGGKILGWFNWWELG